MQRSYKVTPVAKEQFTKLTSETAVAVLKVEFLEPHTISYTLYHVYENMEAALEDQQPGSYMWNVFVGFDPEIYWNNDKEFICFSDPHIQDGFSIVKIQLVKVAVLKCQFGM